MNDAFSFTFRELGELNDKRKPDIWIWKGIE